MKTLVKCHTDKYQSTDGYVLQREDGKTPDGNPMNGKWVYRDSQGQLIDFDMYRNDLAERNNIKLEC